MSTNPPDTPPPSPPGTFTPPRKLDTVFLRGARGELFELTREEAASHQVSDERMAELGHPPFAPPGDEVAGHHKITGGGPAGDVGAWDYHRDWQEGCYIDEITGQFLVGLHRHPYGDERAVGALETDFS